MEWLWSPFQASFCEPAETGCGWQMEECEVFFRELGRKEKGEKRSPIPRHGRHWPASSSTCSDAATPSRQPTTTHTGLLPCTHRATLPHWADTLFPL